jgi:hypothetical protein
MQLDRKGRYSWTGRKMQSNLKDRCSLTYETDSVGPEKQMLLDQKDRCSQTRKRDAVRPEREMQSDPKDIHLHPEEGCSQT